MANARDIEIHCESVGEPKDDGMQPTLLASVGYDKGRGYYLSASVVNKGDGCTSFMLGSGISHREYVQSSKRFSAKTLATLGEALKGSDKLTEILGNHRKELATRIAAGRDF